MSDYRRLISYIYEYEGKEKGKNVGFVKLEARNGQCRLNLSIKKVYVGGNAIGVYLLGKSGIETFLGNIFIRGGNGEFRATIDALNVEGSRNGLDTYYGLTVHDVKNSWRSYTTIWEDAIVPEANEVMNPVPQGVPAGDSVKLLPAHEVLPGSSEVKAAPAVARVVKEIEAEIAREEERKSHGEVPLAHAAELSQAAGLSHVGESTQAADFSRAKELSQTAEVGAGESPEEEKVVGIGAADVAAHQVKVNTDMNPTRGTSQAEGAEEIQVNEESSVEAAPAPEMKREPADVPAQPAPGPGNRTIPAGTPMPSRMPAQGNPMPRPMWLFGGKPTPPSSAPAGVAAPAPSQPPAGMAVPSAPSPQSSAGMAAPSALSPQSSAGMAAPSTPSQQSPAGMTIPPTPSLVNIPAPSSPAPTGRTASSQTSTPMNMPAQQPMPTPAFQGNTRPIMPTMSASDSTPITPVPMLGNVPTPNRASANAPVSMPGNVPAPNCTSANTPVPMPGGASAPEHASTNAPVPMPGSTPVPTGTPAAPSVNPAAEAPREEIPMRSPELENPDVLRYLQQTEDLSTDPERLWQELRKVFPKIQPFDYENGCEILTIRPQDIGRLPRESWVYGNNSFLLHGYYNFRYIILFRLGSKDGRSRYLLGVPGHYYSSEKYMASMFGFPNFVLSKKQPPNDGRFGYWYTDIKIH